MLKENTLVLFCLYFSHLVGVFADTDTVKSVSVKEGDSVTLQIHVTEIQTDDRIDWKFGTNNTVLARIRTKTSEIFNGTDGRFRDRLKLDQTGSLIIMNTRTTDSGLYEVRIRSSSRPEDTHRFSLTVYAATTPAPSSTPPSHPPSHPSSGPHSGSPPGRSSGSSDSPDRFLLVLISAVAGSLLLLAAVGIIWIYRKQRTTDQHAETREDEITYADTTFHKRNAQKSEDDVVYASVVHRR
ncbi:uncharacterized protein LOC113040290 [Carassius auratus]|uniref:Uncharacterized protein LOC113040290 n=1 Tax=Carassius auratus TaxID=7957 RepID=A0A6P6J2U2_CARAU|nr:uncharacterized protein LOC113040290 [Carassius auratus]